MIRNILQLLEILAVLYCLANVFGQKLKYDIYVVALIIVDLFLFTGINEYGFPTAFILLVYILILVYCFVQYKKSIKETLMNFMLSFLSIGIFQLVLRIPVSIIWAESAKQSVVDELVINLCVLVILYINRNKSIFSRIKNLLANKKKAIWVIIVSLILVFAINIFHMKSKMFVDNSTMILFIYFAILFFYILIEWEKTRVEAEKKRIQLEMNEIYAGAFEELISVIRERQHDMKSHISAILGMIYTTNTYEDLIHKQKEYCEEIINRHNESKILLCVENPLLSGFLYMKIQEMISRKIDVEYDIALQERNNIVSEYDLIDMLSILINNAIEEVDNNNGKVIISLYEKANVLHLIVANTCSLVDMEAVSKMFQKNYSSKGIGRGIGLSKLKKIVEDKNGTIEISNESMQSENLLQFHITI